MGLHQHNLHPTCAQKATVFHLFQGCSPKSPLPQIPIPYSDDSVWQPYNPRWRLLNQNSFRRFSHLPCPSSNQKIFSLIDLIQYLILNSISSPMTSKFNHLCLTCSLACLICISIQFNRSLNYLTSPPQTVPLVLPHSNNQYPIYPRQKLWRNSWFFSFSNPLHLIHQQVVLLSSPPKYLLYPSIFISTATLL